MPYLEAIKRESVGRNAYFTELARRGYRIHVYQSDQLDYCRDRVGAPLAGIQSCLTYFINDLASLSEAGGSHLATARLVMSIYKRLFLVDFQLRVRYLMLRQRWPALPNWPAPPLFSPLSSMRVLEDVVGRMQKIRAGDAYFVHLILPHYPYAYDEECEVRPDPNSWLTTGQDGGNDWQARNLRYELYFEQMRCVLKQLAEMFDTMNDAGQYEGAQIVVHGDHGSRIFMIRRRRENALARHSTLFAYKPAGAVGAGSYSQKIAPINLLLPDVLHVKDSRLADQAYVSPRIFDEKSPGLSLRRDDDGA